VTKVLSKVFKWGYIRATKLSYEWDMAHEAASCLGIVSKKKLRKENCIIISLFEQTIIIVSERDTVEVGCVSVAALFHSNVCLLGCFYLCQMKLFQKGAGEGLFMSWESSTLNF